MTNDGETADRPRAWRHLVAWAAVLLIALAATDAGLRLRRAVWFATEGSHFQGDVSSGWRWGDRAARDGLFTFYDDLEATVEPRRRNDYTPLRITVMTAWARWTKVHYPDADRWRDDYDFTAPLLHANTAAEGASAVLVFVIIRLLRRRAWRARRGIVRATDAAARATDRATELAARPAASSPPTTPADASPGPGVGLASGLFGGLLMWFNPAVVWDGHCWPQWDVWLMPFFLAAVLAGCLNLWFAAGVCVVVGAFFKGQMLLAAPILLAWPLLGGNLSAVYRLACGFVVAAAALALPWMRPGPAAWVWVALLTLALGVISFAVWLRRLRWRWLVAVPLVAMALAWPWASHATFGAKLAVFWPLIVVAALGGLPRRLRPHGYALALAVAVLLTMRLFDASSTWFTTGFVYGSEKFDTMLTGSGSWNVPALLIEMFGWDRDQYRPVAVPGLADPVPLRTLLIATYGVTLVVCGLAAAMQARRRDPRLLVAVSVPWLWAFLLMPQMHGRYSVWAAAASALLAGEGVGLALLGIVVSGVAMLGIVENQYLFNRNYWPEALEFLQRLDPGLGWVLLTAALVLTGVALTPRYGQYGKNKRIRNGRTRGNLT